MKSLGAIFSAAGQSIRVGKRFPANCSSHPMLIRIFIVSLIVAFLQIASARAQSPNDGRVEGGAYLNSYFHVSYRWPEILQPANTQQLTIQPPASGSKEFLLFVARQGNGPFGVVMMAEKPNFHAQRSDGLNESQSLLEHIKKSWDPSGNPKVLEETHSTNADGLTFYELDYKHFGDYVSAIATQIGEFQLLFRCTAASPSDLARMTRSVLEMRRTK